MIELRKGTLWMDFDNKLKECHILEENDDFGRIREVFLWNGYFIFLERRPFYERARLKIATTNKIAYQKWIISLE